MMHVHLSIIYTTGSLILQSNRNLLHIYKK